MNSSKHISVDGLKIAYSEAGIGDVAILFVHGNSASRASFSKQLDSELAEKFRLVALDLPGHGDSARDFAADTDPFVYSIPYFSNKLNKFISGLNLHKFVIVGHSLGGHISIAADKLNPLSAGLVVFQTPPLEKAPDMAKGFLPTEALTALLKESPTPQELENLFSALFASPTDIGPFRKMFLQADPLFRRNVVASLHPEVVLGEISHLNSMKSSKAIFHGSSDKLINGDYIRSLKLQNLWKNSVVSIPMSGHCPQWENPNFFNRLISEFVNSI